MSDECARVEILGNEIKNSISSCSDSIKSISAVLSDISRDLMHLKEVISKTDEDGVPLSYVPRSWAKKFDAVLDRFDSLAEPVAKVAVVQGELINLVNKIDRRMESEDKSQEKWRGEINKVIELFGMTKDDVAEIKNKITEMHPQMKESHGFVLKWKYGIWPAVVAGFGAIIAGATAIIKMIQGS